MADDKDNRMFAFKRLLVSWVKQTSKYVDSALSDTSQGLESKRWGGRLPMQATVTDNLSSQFTADERGKAAARRQIMWEAKNFHQG